MVPFDAAVFLVPDAIRDALDQAAIVRAAAVMAFGAKPIWVTTAGGWFYGVWRPKLA